MQKYFTKKLQSEQEKTHVTTIRLDKGTVDTLRDLKNQSGLSQSQIIRKAILEEPIISSNILAEILNMRSELNHLSKLVTTNAEKTAFINLKKQHEELEAKLGR